MLEATHHTLVARIREEFAPLFAPGRAMGASIAADASATRAMATLPLMDRINRLGLSGEDSMAERLAIYETLGHIDANLAAAAPGPVMTGFVLHALADAAQRERYRAIFADGPRWSCFALTEPHSGTDAAALATTATRIAGGWRLDGRKYMVGQGAVADVVVVFARSGTGPLGVEAFMLRPAAHPGFAARRLPLAGLEGTNLSELTLDGVMVTEEARLGAHLRPVERSRRSVSATLDAMRPCLGAVALGLVRAALERAVAEGLVPDRWTGPHRLRLTALLGWGMRIAAARDAGVILARDAGLMKQAAVAAAQEILCALLVRVPATALADHPWLRRAWRDAGAFEYMEGTSAIHRLNGAAEFRAAGRLSGV